MDGKKGRVLAAMRSGYCNTSQDVADETGIPVHVCSSYLGQLVRKRWLRRTDRWLPNTNPEGRGRRLRVFEMEE